VSGRRSAAVAIAALALIPASSLSAHEGGAARVTLRLERSGRYELDARLDPGHLPSGGSEAFVRGLALEFEGARSIPRPIGEGAPPSGAPFTLHFDGEIPPGSSSVTVLEQASIGEILVEVDNEGVDTPARQWTRGGWRAGPFAVASAPTIPGIGETIARYTPLGFRHIVPGGLDHILFVLGLFLASRRIRPLLAQVSAFTVAHSLTLGLAMLGVVTLPPSIVEPAMSTMPRT